MSSPALADRGVAPRAGGVRRLFVAWQDPEIRSITPVACLTRRQGSDGDTFQFYYLRRVRQLPHFRPFVGFPSLHETYESTTLFPFFENRIMPRSRDDYSDYVEMLGLSVDADPFEILARSEGRRATDTIEVFPEPNLENDTVTCRLLVHGVRHVAGAHDAIDDLRIGDALYVLPDPMNEFDEQAVLLRTGGYRLVGYIPAYFTSLIHRPLNDSGLDAVRVNVAHIGDRSGPSHLRLLCTLAVRWPYDVPPLADSDFQPLNSEEPAVVKPERKGALSGRFTNKRSTSRRFAAKTATTGRSVSKTATTGRFVVRKGATGNYGFDLVAKNGQVIASSQSYKTKASALKAVQSVKRNAPDAEVDDQT
jgi:uncharacterized protein YegP (UPF0339 family)